MVMIAKKKAEREAGNLLVTAPNQALSANCIKYIIDKRSYANQNKKVLTI